MLRSSRSVAVTGREAMTGVAVIGRSDNPEEKTIADSVSSKVDAARDSKSSRRAVVQAMVAGSVMTTQPKATGMKDSAGKRRKNARVEAGRITGMTTGVTLTTVGLDSVRTSRAMRIRHLP